jgi:hypothetical protein
MKIMVLIHEKLTMKLEKYNEQIKELPQQGKQIIGQSDGENIIVYQAFNPNIATYAVDNQLFGGSAYSFNRMSWIKPNFLWMMYRAGWAQKEGQEHILAITLPLVHFKTILAQATISSFDDSLFESHEAWKNELSKTEVRLQWDPDHNPFGEKQERKAIQLGMKGDILKAFCIEWITKIEDITPFVKEQFAFVETKNLENLSVPTERIITIDDEKIATRIGLQA